MYNRFFALVALLGAAALNTAIADTLVLTNGDRITGRFIEIDDGNLVFRADSATPPLSIPLGAVAQLETDEAIRVLLEDGTEVRGLAMLGDDGRIRLASEALDDAVSFPVERITRGRSADAPPPSPIRSSGDINLGAQLTDGNTRSRSVSANTNATVRSDVNRVRFNAEINRERTADQDTVDNAAAGLRYDHFLSERFFATTNFSVVRDRFRDLRLRTTVGAGAGYQFFDTDQRTLSAEAGVSYVNEDFITTENQDNPAGRWALDYRERFLDGGLRLFHNQEGLVSLDHADDFVVRTRTGVRFPFVIGMTGTFQVNVDYENEPRADARRTDSAYIITAGYSW